MRLQRSGVAQHNTSANEMARAKKGVYEAIFTGLMKVFLVFGIGALSLGKFAGFEWCAMVVLAALYAHTTIVFAGFVYSITIWNLLRVCKASEA